MKRLKILTMCVLASSMVLSGCNREHVHVDENHDFICDDCNEPFAGIKTFSMSQENIISEIGATINVKDYLTVEAVNGATDEVTWSIDNTRVADLNELGVVTILDYGKVKVTAISKFDASITKSIDILVPFENDFAEAGFTFDNVFPVDQVVYFADTTAENVFVPSPKFADLGLWYHISIGSETEYACLTIVFNIDSASGSERSSEYGNELIAELQAYKDYYMFLEIESQGEMFMSKDGSYVLSWKGFFNADYSNMYLAFNYYLVSELYYGNKKTTNTDWTDDEKQTLNDAFGTLIPFTQFGENYFLEYDAETDAALLIDFNYDYTIIENYKAILLDAGYKYSDSEGAYFKPIDENYSIFINPFFSDYGNTVIIYISNTVFDTFPTQLVNNFIKDEIGSSNTVIPFELTSEEMKEYRVYIQEDEYDSYPYADYSLEVRGLFANYDEFVALKDAYVAAGFTLTNSSYYETENPEHLYEIVLEKGALEVGIVCEPEFSFDWESDVPVAVTNFDHSTICLNVHHGEKFETDGFHFYSKNVVMYTDDYPTLVNYALTNVDGNVTFTSNNNDVAYIDEDGFLVPVKKGQATITGSVGGSSDTFNVFVLWGYNEAEITFDSLPTNPTIVENDSFKLELAKGDGTKAPEYNDGHLHFFNGNKITMTAKDGHMFSEVDFTDAEDYGEANHGNFVADKGNVDGVNWYAADFTTNVVNLTVNDGDIIVDGVNGMFDDWELHTARMSFAEMVEYTRANYELWGFDIVSCGPYYEGSDDYAMSLVVSDTIMYPYGEYGEDGLGYEMYMLADLVPEEFAEDIYANMYMGDHYMYELSGCMCDVSVDSIELDIMIYADTESGATIIRIDFWDWH